MDAASILHAHASGHHRSTSTVAGDDADRDSPHGEGHWSGDDSAAGDLDNGIHDGSRKRRRPMSVSCELCKQRKVKCDRGQPSCGWCSRNGQICEYKERKKPGLRAGYGRELEQRLDRLEGILSTHSRILESHFGNGMSQSVNALMHQESPTFHSPSNRQHQVSQEPPQTFFQQSQPIFGTNKEHHTPSAGSIHDYNGAVGPTTPAFSQGSGYQQHNPQGTMPPQSSAQTAGYYQTAHTPIESPSLNLANGGSSSSTSTDHDFPPYDLLYALTDLYFKHVNTWCPILHRRTTLDALFGSSTLEEEDRILLHAIVATTLRFSTDSRLTDDLRRHYHDVSKQRVLLYGLENSSVKSLQALVILALDLVGSSNGPPGWNLLALITRQVVQLGLSVESTSSTISPRYPSIYTLPAAVLPEPKSWIEDESRRRLFWMVYLLDRYATFATAFDFALDEKQVDRKLPCREDLFSRNQPVETRWSRPSEHTDHVEDKPENLGSFSYYIEILGILSRIHQWLKKPLDISALCDVEKWQGEYRELDNMLTAWKLSLPHEYGNMSRLFNSSGNKIVNCGWVMLHATYNVTMIRLNSSAAYPTTRSPIFTPSYSASQRCQTAVENITSLAKYVTANNLLSKLGPPFAFTLWVGARLCLIHGSTIEHTVSPDINFLVQTLADLGRYWHVAGRYSAVLQRVLDEQRAAEQATAAHPRERRVTPPSVQILRDMRRNAYDLDLLISRQPRHQFSGDSVNGAAGAGVSGAPGQPNPEWKRTRTPGPNELEYLDVFDFFNYPRMPVPPAGGADGSSTPAGDAKPDAATKTEPPQTQHHPPALPPSSTQPHANVSTTLAGSDHSVVPTGVGSTRDGEGEALGIPGVEMGSVGNEFNITNFMVDASSDWLFKTGS